MYLDNHRLKPLLKWVGGKRWLVPMLQNIWSHCTQQHTLTEPFAGGMAITLGLNPKCAKLNDAISNPISKIESVTPFPIIGMNTNTIEIPAC